jgi:hypothetical protein
MKRRRVIALTVGLGLAGLVAAALAQERGAVELPAAKLQQTFLEAGRAYDEGRVKDAIATYGQLVEQGYEAPELFFNLGNAWFKSGKAGQAVLNYRRAWYETPRDPDALANLRFALQGTGASGSSFPALVRALLRFNRREWTALAVIFYWTAAVALGVSLVARRRREWVLRVAAVSAALLVLSLSGIGSWWSLTLRPEAVVLEPGQQALFAPLEGSTPHFALPEGSIVRVAEESGDWLKVISGKQSGWARRAACGFVLGRRG